MRLKLIEKMKLGFRNAAPMAAIMLAKTNWGGYDAVGIVVAMLISIALPALILISIVKMIMNHIRA